MASRRNRNSSRYLGTITKTQLDQAATWPTAEQIEAKAIQLEAESKIMGDTWMGSR